MFDFISPKKIYAFGDIHGHLKELTELFSKIPESDKEKSTIVFLGDLIDRGPDSRGVVDFIINKKTEGWKIVTVIGNHEKMLLEFLDGGAAGGFIFNGGGATLTSYADQNGDYREGIKNHEKFFREMVPYFETGKYFFVHAGLPDLPLKEIKKSLPEEMFTIRDEWLNGKYEFEKTIIHGHTPEKTTKISKRRIGIDTGVRMYKRLSFIELPSNKVTSVGTDIAEYTPFTGSSKDHQHCRRSVRYSGELPVEIRATRAIFDSVTINFSELGILCHCDPRVIHWFKNKDKISGEINLGYSIASFDGEVVRIEEKEDYSLIAISFSVPIFLADEHPLKQNLNHLVG